VLLIVDKYLKCLFLVAMAINLSFLSGQVHSEDQQMRQEFRAGPSWHGSSETAGDKQLVDVVIQLPGGTPPLVGANLKLRINGRDVSEASSIKNFQQSGQQLAWLVCIESSSALLQPQLKTIKNALFSLFKDRQSLLIALSTFGTRCNNKLSFAEDTSPAALTHAIESLKSSKGKNKSKLFDSLLSALDYYEQASERAYERGSIPIPKRRRILLIAEGNDQGSDANYKAVVDRATALGIPIDVVGIKSSKQANAGTQPILNMIADATGGRFAPVTKDLNGLTEALVNIHRILTETQTVVASFQYNPNRRVTARQVDVVLQYPSSTQRIAPLEPKGLPVPEEEYPIPTPPPVIPPDGWLIAVAVAIFLAGVLLYWFIRAPKPKPVSPSPVSNNKKPPVVIINQSPQQNPKNHEELPNKLEQSNMRKTVVGGALPSQVGTGSLWLVGVGGAVQGRIIQVNKPVFTIGASSDNDLVITEDDYVSSKHAIIRCDHEHYYIVDQNSLNGTFVNDNRVLNTAFALEFGNKIRFGHSIFELRRSQTDG
jgi:hypothetical protein